MGRLVELRIESESSLEQRLRNRLKPLLGRTLNLPDATTTAAPQTAFFVGTVTGSLGKLVVTHPSGTHSCSETCESAWRGT